VSQCYLCEERVGEQGGVKRRVESVFNGTALRSSSIITSTFIGLHYLGNFCNRSEPFGALLRLWTEDANENRRTVDGRVGNRVGKVRVRRVKRGNAKREGLEGEEHHIDEGSEREEDVVTGTKVFNEGEDFIMRQRLR